MPDSPEEIGSDSENYGNKMNASITHVITKDGSDLLGFLYVGDVARFANLLDSKLKDNSKFGNFCTSQITHRPTKRVDIPLVYATKSGNPGFLQYMLTRGVNPNYAFILGKNGKTPITKSLLFMAIEAGNTDTAAVLLAKNADVNQKDSNGETALHQATRKLNTAQVRLLLTHGANPAFPDRFLNAPLHSAAHSGHLQLVKTLLKYNADIYQKGQWGALPLQIAAREGHAHIVELFCKGSAGTCNLSVCVPCASDGRARAPVHLAAEKGHYETLTVLLEDHNADPNVADKDKNTALHFLVIFPYNGRVMRPREDYVESARVLVSCGADVNAQNRFGDTALHLAVMNGYHSVMEVLVEAGADPNRENKHRLRPHDVVMKKDTVGKEILQNARAQFKARQKKEAIAREDDGLFYAPSTGSHPSKVLNRSMDIDLDFMAEHSNMESEFLDDPSYSGRAMSRRSVRSAASGSKRRPKPRSKSVDPYRRQMSDGGVIEERAIADHSLQAERHNRTAEFIRYHQIEGETGYPPDLEPNDYNLDQQIPLPRQPGDKSHIYARVNVVRGQPEYQPRYRSPSVPSVLSQSTAKSRGRYLDSSLSHASSHYSPETFPARMHGHVTRAANPTFSSVSDNVHYDDAYDVYEDMQEQEQRSPPPREVLDRKTTRPTKKVTPEESNDSIKVSTVRGKPGTIEVEYGGKTLEIEVDDVRDTGTKETPTTAEKPKSDPPKRKKVSKKKKKAAGNQTEDVSGPSSVERAVPAPVGLSAEAPPSQSVVGVQAGGNSRDPAVALANVLLESARMQVRDETRLAERDKRENDVGARREEKPTYLADRHKIKTLSMENMCRYIDSSPSESEDSDPVTVVAAQNNQAKNNPRIKIGFINQCPYVSTTSTFV